MGRRAAALRALAIPALDAVLASYGQVLFSRRRAVSVLLLAATFVVPQVGLAGLLGVAFAAVASRLLGLDRDAARSGLLGYNALLVFLLIGASLRQSAAFWAMAAVVAAAVVLCHVALASGLSFHLRLPVMSLPFVLVGWLVLLAVPYVRGMGVRTELAGLGMGAFPGPAPLDLLLRSLGAIFFAPWWGAGALVLLALLIHSRIATLHALLGFAVAILADRFLFSFPPGFLPLYAGFNFVVVAIALGGVFYVPGPQSLLLAALGSLTSGLVCVGLVRALQPLGLPVLALPFNVVVLTTLYALGQRRPEALPRRVDFIAGSPEENLNFFRTRVERFRGALPVRLQLPFRGSWLVTQGHDGEHTHQGAWRHGLDFEVADRQGRRHRETGQSSQDWLCYRLPALAPAAGTVVRVVDGCKDQAPGDADTESNWGNVVVVHHGPGVFSLIAHLSFGTIAVREGQVVAAGQELGRVGSSGRAPVPHLHFQLQATPMIGDPTIPLEFGDVVIEPARDARGDDAADAGAGSGPRRLPRVLGRHVPVQGQRVRNVVRSEAMARTLALPPGERLLATVRSGPRVRREELISDMDALGNRSLVSPARDARLWFENRGDAFVVYDFAGPKDSALFAFYAALGRLPLEDGEDLEWSDRLDPRRLGSTPLGWLRDAAAALVTPPRQPMEWRATRENGMIVVLGESPGGRTMRAVRTRTFIEPDRGVRALSVAVGRRTTEVEFA